MPARTTGRAVSVIYENEISTCFDYLCTIESENTKKIMGLLRMPNTYGMQMWLVLIQIRAADL